jgi:hypothetical protein
MSKRILANAWLALLAVQVTACGGPGPESEDISVEQNALFTDCGGGAQAHCWREPSINVTNFDFGGRLLCFSYGSQGPSSSNIIDCSVSTGGVPSGATNRLGYATGNTFPTTTKSIAIHDAISQHTYVLVLGSDDAIRTVHGDVSKPWFDGTNFATQVLWALPVDVNLQAVCLQKIATVAVPSQAPKEEVIGLTCSGSIYRFTGAPGGLGGHWEPAGASMGFNGLPASGWTDISSIRGAYGATLLSSSGAVWRAGFGGLDSHANPFFSPPVQLPVLKGTQGQVLTPRGVGGPFVVTNAGPGCTSKGCVGDDQRFYRFDFGTGIWTRYTGGLDYTPTPDEIGFAPFFGPQIADASTFTGAPWDFGVHHIFSRLYYWHSGTSTVSLPSSGRSAGLARTDGLSSNFYRAPNNEVKGITLNSASQWAIENLSSLSGSGPALSNIAGYVSKGGYSNVTFRGSQAHLIQVAAVGNQWVATDFFNTLSAPLVAGSPTGYARADQYSSIVYRGSNGHLYEVFQPISGNPGLGDLMAVAPTAALAAEDPFAFVRGDNKSSVLYASTSDRHVRELVLGSAWTPQDVTAAVGGPASAGRVRGFVRSDGYTVATYRAADGHIWELSMAPGQSNWTGSADLSGPSVPVAAGDPVPYVRKDGVNAIVFRVVDGRVGELALVNGNWRFGDLNQASNGAPLAKDTSTPAGYVRADGATVVAYESTTGNVIELALINGGWVESDLTSIVGGP